MKFNLPNLLTVIRIFMAPVFLVFLMAEMLPHNFLWSFIIFSVASITDFVDGKLARKNNQVTNLGKLLDPLADKMLTTAALLGFMKFGLCNIWVLMIVLTREFTVTGIRMIATVQNVVIPANIWGKIKTATQMTFSIVIMLIAELIADFHFMPYQYFITASNIAMWIIAAFTFISGAIYVVQAVKVIDFSK
ncbi:MAG: CDP-diacylglycerol--glycerol-3-phosphate 3-phosphatidyltransferase [Clostridia bacterium]|nr:CDP-diacylglycerol--glycerol-3-phosphate 3-phosphatidyltransferase [Clostridia bacterium]